MSENTVTIFFEGKPLPCRAGLSVAAALWENGVRVLSHSPKYGRPRGVSCARGHCMSCLMRIDGVPNVRACRTEVHEDLTAGRQDSGAFYGRAMQKVLDTGGHLLPVGFYYKWFTKPTALSRIFMDGIRPMTGIGRLPDPSVWREDGGEPPARDLGLLDTVVVGAGAAGLAAAADTEGDVLLLDDMPLRGGQRRAALDRVATDAADVLSALPRLLRLREALAARNLLIDGSERISIRLETRVVGAYQPDMLLLKDTEGLLTLRARRIIWAGGAWDRAGAFEDNDLPGILGPRALYRLLATDGMDVRGARAIVCGHGLDLWLSAALLHAAGARVVLALDDDCPADGAALETAQRHGWALHTGLAPVRALSRNSVLSGIVFKNGGARTELPADLAVVCVRAKPAYDVPYQLGAELELDPARGGYVPAADDTGSTVVTLVGEATGALPEDMLEGVTS